MLPSYESPLRFQEGWSSLQTHSRTPRNPPRGLTLQMGMLGNLKARTALRMCSKNLQLAPNCGSWANKTKTITLTNSGSASIRLSRAHVSGSSFKVSGLSLPLTLGPKQNTTFNVVFAPGRTGNISGSVSLVSNDARYATTIVLSGTGVQRHLVVNPTSTSFGNVGLGTHSAHTITLTNPGPASVTVYRYRA